MYGSYRRECCQKVGAGHMHVSVQAHDSILYISVSVYAFNDVANIALTALSNFLEWLMEFETYAPAKRSPTADHNTQRHHTVTSSVTPQRVAHTWWPTMVSRKRGALGDCFMAGWLRGLRGKAAGGGGEGLEGVVGSRCAHWSEHNDCVGVIYVKNYDWALPSIKTSIMQREFMEQQKAGVTIEHNWV